MWDNEARADEFDCSITVCARFKPSGLEAPSLQASKREGTEVLLPLHQRIQLIRAQQCSSSNIEPQLKTAKAFQLLFRSRDFSNPDSSLATDPWSEASCLEPLDIRSSTSPTSIAGEVEDDSSDVKPARSIEGVVSSPTQHQEQTNDENSHNIQEHFSTTFGASIMSVDSVNGTILSVSPSVGLRRFCFDKVFDEDCTQVRQSSDCVAFYSYSIIISSHIFVLTYSITLGISVPQHREEEGDGGGERTQRRHLSVWADGLWEDLHNVR